MMLGMIRGKNALEILYALIAVLKHNHASARFQEPLLNTSTNYLLCLLLNPAVKGATQKPLFQGSTDQAPSGRPSAPALPGFDVQLCVVTCSHPPDKLCPSPSLFELVAGDPECTSALHLRFFYNSATWRAPPDPNLASREYHAAKSRAQSGAICAMPFRSQCQLSMAGGPCHSRAQR